MIAPALSAPRRRSAQPTSKQTTGSKSDCRHESTLSPWLPRARPRLGTDIVGRRQGKAFPIPEGRMVAGVIVGISAQNVEYHTSIELAQGFGRVGKTMADDFSQILGGSMAYIAIISSRHKQRQRRHEWVPSEPSFWSMFRAVERSISKTSLPSAAASLTDATLRPASFARRMAINSAFTTL